MATATAAADSETVSTSDRPPSSDDDRVYLVPYKWWRGAKEEIADDQVQGVPYSATSASSYYGIRIINNLLGSDLVLHLRRCYGDTSQQTIGQDVEPGSGRSYALIRSDFWSRAVKWYENNPDLMPKNYKSAQINDDDENSAYVYPLLLRISVMQEINMTIKISKKDNASDNYKRASKVFVDSEPVHIWDFSGQTNLILMNEMNRIPFEFRNSDQEILLEVQVYVMPGSRNGINEEQNSKPSSFNFTHRLFSRCEWDLNSEIDLDSPGLGLIGLENLGNTCFMNSAVQCLAHTQKLVDYFHGNYTVDINKHNPLGMKGEIALAFGNLLRRLWRSDKRPIGPHNFKSKLSHFAPQFSGFNQHDSQELLAFLLDGLHEDLNRVKSKPYSEAKDSDGRSDDDVAEEYWDNHLARNDSIIVDTCHGQYKSTLVCPVCNKVSTTFDPFMYLSLPLPCTAKRIMTVTVFSTDGTTEALNCTITVPKSGTFSDFIQILSKSCSLRDDEMLLVAEVYKSGILRFLEEPSDLISLLRDDDRLAAYRIPKEQSNASIVVFMHQKCDESDTFGVPLVTRLPDKIDGTTLRTTYQKLINPFLRKKRSSVSDDSQEDWNSSNLSNCTDSTDSSDISDESFCTDLEDDLTFVIADDKGQIRRTETSMVESFHSDDAQPVQSEQDDKIDEIGQSQTMESCQSQTEQTEASQSDETEQIGETEETQIDLPKKRVHVVVQWSVRGLAQCDVSLFSSVPEIYKELPFRRRYRDQESATLYQCLDTFIKEEPLGPDDMWYCPRCKEHRQASKKLDLWRLPEILVIHLKRFQYNRYTKDKLETYVEFPIHDLDLSEYIAHRGASSASTSYRLYAISNHYGHLGGGHYTAYAFHEGEKRWYNFDDQFVRAVPEENIKTGAAYVLFYRRFDPTN